MSRRTFRLRADAEGYFEASDRPFIRAIVVNDDPGAKMELWLWSDGGIEPHTPTYDMASIYSTSPLWEEVTDGE